MKDMKKCVSVAMSLALISVFTWSLMGCGADIKAENEKLKAENTVSSLGHSLYRTLKKLEGR
jgi:hypothetical protein